MSQPLNNQIPEPAFPMKWHKFLIYFSLWAGAAIMLFNAFSFFAGTHYGDSAAQVYAVFTGLRTVDILIALLYVGIAVYTIITRFALANYKSNAPTMLTWVYVMSMVASFIYPIAASMVTGMEPQEMLDGNALGRSIGSSIIWIFTNRAYYQKRSELFNQ